MEYLPEFITNHFILFSLFVGILMALVFTTIRDIKLSKITIDPQHMVSMLNSGHVTIIDIRDKESYKKAHILNATNVPKASKNEIIKLIKKKKTVIYCESGYVSNTLVQQIVADGHENCYGLKGGLENWMQASMPVAKAK